MKRLLSAFLAIVLSLSVVAQNVSATELFSAGGQENSAVVENGEEADKKESVEEPVEEEPADSDAISEAELLAEQGEEPKAADHDEKAEEIRRELEDKSSRYGEERFPGEGDVESMSVYAEGEDRLQEIDLNSALPTQYNTSDQYTLPSLRRQTGGTCWAHAMMATAEISMIKQGYDVSPDYAEYHLAYFRYNTPTDPLGGTVGDTTLDRGHGILSGWNADRAGFTVASWVGAADDALAPDGNAVKENGLPDSCAYTDLAHMKNFYIVNYGTEEDRTAVKRLIKDCGAAYLSYNDDDNAYNSTYNSYYHSTESGGSHAVTIVGWDDNFSKYHFGSEIPEGNGAWLIRNSWWIPDYETYAGIGPESHYGYFWMSYYDVSINTVYGFEYEDATNYNNNYQYDGSPFTYWSEGRYAPDEAMMANVFQVHASSAGETLKAASFYTENSNLDYEIKVYVNLSDPADPTSGECVSTTFGSTTYPGYYTARLSSPVSLEYGDTFSIVVKLIKEGDIIEIFREQSYDFQPLGADYEFVSSSSSGQSFWFNGSVWRDVGADGKGNIRIKAFTDNGATESYIPYYVRFHSNNGSTDSIVTQTIYRNTSTPLRTNTFTKTGHSFYRWNTKADGTGNSYRDGYSAYNLGPKYGTIDLYAQWTPSKYTVILDPNGGSCSTSSKQVTYGNSWSLPSATRSGYTFDGWYTSQTGGTKIENNTTITITRGTTLYAHWNGTPYTVTFNANGGNCATTSKTVYYGSTYGVLPTPTRTGYNFAGWYTTSASTGGNKIENGTTVSITQNQTLYARWTANTYTVTFNANAGTDSVSGLSQTTVTVTYGSTYGASGSLPTPSRTGYNFVGWYTTSASAGGNLIGNGTTVTITQNQTLYARWTAKTYTVTYNANGGLIGTSETVERTVTYGKSYGYSSSLPTPSRTGYSFDGWYTTNASSGGTRIYDSTTVTITSAQTLYARWSARTYTVSFNANAGTDSVSGLSPTSKYVTYGSTYGTLPTLTRTGYTFEGWYTSQTGGTPIYAGTTVTITASQTLYARWTANTYTVTFNANAGTDSVSGLSPATITVTYGSTYGTLPAPSRTGYTFDGWYTSQTGGNRIYGSTKVTITSAQTLYARWSIGTYKVTFNANANGDSVSGLSPASKYVTYGSTYGASGTLPAPTRTGYTFEGWYTTSASTGGTRIYDSTPVTITSAQTLYARWTARTYTVTFNANAGTDSVSGLTPTSMEVTYGSTYSASGTLPTPTRTGYEFAGWYTTESPSGGNKIENGTTVRITQAQTLYAWWTLMSFAITVDGNGGNWNGEELLIFYRNWNEFFANEELFMPTRARYHFTGWYDDPALETVHDFTVPVREAQIIYAGWKRAEGFRVEGLEKEYVYTGSPIKPQIEVYDDEYSTEPLILNTDYSLTFRNNTNVGFATVIVKGKGNYAKELPLTFEIKQRNLSDNIDNPYAEEFSADDIVVAYNAKKAQIPNPVILRNGKKLVKNKDYRVHWFNEKDEADQGITASKAYDVMITGVNNYTGTRKIKFTVAKQEQKLISKTKIKVASVEWTGNAEAPVVTVTDGKTSLFEGTHYEIIYPGNADPKEPWKDAGTVPIMIKGIEENGYAGSVRTTYQIKGTPLNAGWFGMNWWPYSEFTYTGEEQEYEPWNSKYGVTVWLSNGQMVELKKGTDFEVRYENNINAGRATAVITGKGRFTGTVKKTFTIKPDTGGHPGYDYSSFTLIHTTIKVPFEKGGCRPKIETLELRWDHERDPLKLGKDYTLSYRNNQKLPDQFAFGDKAPQIVVKGIGNYKGMSFTIPFEILAQSIADSDAISVDVPDMVFTGKAGGYAVTPILTDQRNHKQLANNKDFKVLGYYYAESISAAEEKVYRMDRGQKVYLNKAADEPVDKKDIIPAGTNLYVKIQGINGYTGEIEKEKAKFTVAKGNLSKAKVKVEVQEYTGSEIKITKEDILSITGPGNVAISEDDYEILNNYSKNTKPGTASVTLRGKGNYAGVKTVTFKIRQRWLFFPGIF